MSNTNTVVCNFFNGIEVNENGDFSGFKVKSVGIPESAKIFLTNDDRAESLRLTQEKLTAILQYDAHRKRASEAEKIRSKIAREEGKDTPNTANVVKWSNQLRPLEQAIAKGVQLGFDAKPDVPALFHNFAWLIVPVAKEEPLNALACVEALKNDDFKTVVKLLNAHLSTKEVDFLKSISCTSLSTSKLKAMKAVATNEVYKWSERGIDANMPKHNKIFAQLMMCALATVYGFESPRLKNTKNKPVYVPVATNSILKDDDIKPMD